MSLPLPLRNKLNINLKKRQLSKGRPAVSQSQIMAGQQNKLKMSLSEVATNKYDSPRNALSQYGSVQNSHVTNFAQSQSLNGPEISSFTPLQSFKATYDNLHKNYIQKTRQVDELGRDKKRLQIQLSNINAQYYEKEISRLRAEAEKYQIENQSNKLSLLQSENQMKQSQVSLKLKSQQCKNMLKQLEKQKIAFVQLKHSSSEREKNFLKVTSEMQKNNKHISENYEEIRAKLQKLQTAFKEKCTECDQFKLNYQILKVKFNESEQTVRLNKSAYEKELDSKTRQIAELEAKLRQSTSKYQACIEKLGEELEESINKRTTEGLITNQKIETANLFKNCRVIELEKVRLEQSNSHLKFEMTEKDKYIKTLQERLRESLPRKQYQQLQANYKEIEDRETKIIKEYQSRLIKVQKELQGAKMNLFEARNHYQDNTLALSPNFNESLKGQIEDNIGLKRQLAEKLEELFRIKTQFEQSKLKVKLLEDEMNLLRKRARSGENNLKIESDIASQNLRNQAQSLRRKLETTEMRFINKVKELKEKENFIMSTIIGRSRQQDVPIIMAEFQRIYEADYVNRLFEAKEKIKELQTKSQ